MKIFLVVFAIFAAGLQAQNRSVILVRAGSSATSGTSVSGLTITATTPMQAIIDFDKTAGTDVQIETSESSTYAPLFNDVDPTEYAGSNLGSRDPSLCAVSASHCTFVSGKRAADVASDGVRYSRAHALLTTYYVRITPIAGTATTTSFTTGNLPFGVGYVESQLVDPARPGYTAFPTMPHSTKDFQTVDPITGVKLRPLSIASDTTNNINNVAVDVTAPSAWVNPTALQSTSPDGSTFATVSGSTAPVLLSLQNGYFLLNSVRPDMHGYGLGNYGSFGAWQLTLQAAVNRGGAVSGTAADNTIRACLTIDGANCFSPIKEAVLTNTIAPVIFGTAPGGSGAVVDLWQSNDMARVPAWYDEAVRFGNGTCDGSVNVVWTGGHKFNTNWAAGSNFGINGTVYKIASVISPNALTLQTTCPAATNAGWGAENFGALVWKKTASSDTVSVDSASVNYRIDTVLQEYISGGPRSFNPLTVAGAGGELGNLGIFGSHLYWVGTESGIAKNLAIMAGYGTSANAGSYDPLHAERLFGSANDDFYVLAYYGDYSTPIDSDVFTTSKPCSGSAPYTASQPCFAITRYNGIRAALTRFTASQEVPYTSTLFAAGGGDDLAMVGVDVSGPAFLRLSQGHRTDTMAYLLMFDPYATTDGDGGTAGCISGGGCIRAATPNWTLGNARWSTWKDGGSPAPGWTMNFTQNPQIGRGNGFGPWFTTVVNGTPDGSVNVIPTDRTLNTACPPNSYGAPTTAPPNAECTQITVAGEPIGISFTSGVTIEPGHYGPAHVGDEFVVGTYDAADVEAWNYFRYEINRILTKTPGSVSGTWVYTYWHGISTKPPFFNNTTDLATQQTGTYISFHAGTKGLASDYSALQKYEWNWAADVHGTSPADVTSMGPVPYDVRTSAGHLGTDGVGDEIDSGVNLNEIRVGSVPSFAASNIYSTYSLRVHPGTTYNQSLALGHNAYFSFGNQFNGSTTESVQAGSVGQLQTHAGIFRAPDALSPYANMIFDARPYRGGAASGTTNPGIAVGGGDCPFALVSGTTMLWKAPAACMYNIGIPYQKNYPTTAFAGDRALVNVSAPGSVIDSSTAGRWTWCMAAVAGECQTGSIVGDTFVNAPVSLPYCYNAGQSVTLGDGEIDICISGSPSVKDASVQFDGLGGNSSDGSIVRVITKYTGARFNNAFYTPMGLTSNGKWMAHESHLLNEGSNGKQMVLVRLPPRPAADGINRLAFEPVQVTIPQRANSLAYERFWYEEFTSPRGKGCTDRAEYCVAVGTSTTFPASSPFQMERTETYTAPDVSSGSAVIQVPGVPLHTLYHQHVWKDKSSGVLTLGPVAVTAIP